MSDLVCLEINFEMRRKQVTDVNWTSTSQTKHHYEHGMRKNGGKSKVKRR